MPPRNFVEINRFLFLIHPFYAMYHNFSGYVSPAQRVSSQQIKKSADFLAERWIKAIKRGLADPNVAIVLVKVDPQNDSALSHSIQTNTKWAKEYAKADKQIGKYIRRVKRIAGRRFFLVNDEIDVPAFIKRVRLSGFTIHPRYTARFFGEALDRCVKTAYRQFFHVVRSQPARRVSESQRESSRELERRIRMVPWLSTGALNPHSDEVGEKDGLGSYAKNLKEGINRLRAARKMRKRSR